MRVTRPNLLAWYDSASDPDALPTFSPDCRTGALITYPGEISQFYINLITPMDYPTGNGTATLVQYRESGTATAVTGNVETDILPITGVNLLAKLTCPSVGPGLYRWKIVWGAVTYVSGIIEVMSEADARACSIRFVIRHTKSLQGVRYAWVGPLFLPIETKFTTQLRVRTHKLGVAEYPVEKSAYRETTGITRNYNMASDKLIKFQIPTTDETILEGVAWALLHDIILINNLPVTVQDHLSITSGRGNLASAQFSVLDNTYATALIP